MALATGAVLAVRSGTPHVVSASGLVLVRGAVCSAARHRARLQSSYAWCLWRSRSALDRRKLCAFSRSPLSHHRSPFVGHGLGGHSSVPGPGISGSAVYFAGVAPSESLLAAGDAP